MKNTLRYFCLLFCTILFLSCSNSEVYEKGIKNLDSLEGALGLITREMQNTDTVQLNAALERFSIYGFFIKTQVKDTLSPAEAEAIKKFFQSGAALESYMKNRAVLLARSALMHSQRVNLRSDMAEGIPEEPELKMALDKEMNASRDLSNTMLDQQKKYYNTILEFKQALPLTEEFIRKHNMNELPALVKQKEDF